MNRNIIRLRQRPTERQSGEQDGVILFSGTARRQGLIFTLFAGSLVYGNQMST